MEMNSVTHLDNDEVEPIVTDEFPTDKDAIEDIGVQEVEVNIVEDDLSEDEWRRSFLEYLINNVLPDDPKLKTMVERQT